MMKLQFQMKMYFTLLRRKVSKLIIQNNMDKIMLGTTEIEKVYAGRDIVFARKPYKQEVEGLVANSPDAYLLTDIILNDISDMEFEITGKCEPNATMLFGVRNALNSDKPTMMFGMLGASSTSSYSFRIQASATWMENSNLGQLDNEIHKFIIKSNDVKELIRDGEKYPRIPNGTYGFANWNNFSVNVPLCLFVLDLLCCL